MYLVQTLAHFVYPSFTNNHKAKLLHSPSIFFLVFVLFVYQVTARVFPITGIRVLGYASSIPPDEVIRLTNEKREAAGLSTLKYNKTLSLAAKTKGEHMLNYDYWAHTAPDGTEPWKFFLDAGYEYRYAGENLARDFSNPTSAVDAWMASDSHRDNILSSKYSEIGIAVIEGDLAGVDTTIIVQFFGTQLSGSGQVPLVQAKPQVTQVLTPILTQSPIDTPTPTPYSMAILTSPTPPTTLNNLSEEGNTESFKPNFLISPFETTRGISIAVTGVLLVVLIIDGIVVARRRIPRIGGRTVAHLAFLGMVLALALIAKAGQIL